jgi:hypothetical protein
MATTTKVMARTAAATSSATLYTVPTGTTAVLTNILVTNTSSSAATFTITIDGVAAFSATSIDANSTLSIDMKQVVGANKVVAGLASATTVNFHISGVEIV